MKTKLLTLALFLFIGSSAFSQSFSLGIKGGANLGKIDGESFKDEFTLGYNIGAFTTLGLGNKISIQPEVLFNQVNPDTSANFSDVFKVQNAANIKLKYLSIPILLNYKLDKLITLQAGPQFGILLNPGENLFQNGKDAFKSGNFSLVGGIQLDILKFRIYGRYVGGLTNLKNLDNSGTWKGSAIQLGVGLSLL